MVLVVSHPQPLALHTMETSLNALLSLETARSAIKLKHALIEPVLINQLVLLITKNVLIIFPPADTLREAVLTLEVVLLILELLH